jgi:putative endonuclease
LAVSTTSAGRAAESRVVEALVARGYRLLDRNWRTRWGEIDLVMEHGGTVHFIEVKYRSTSASGVPEEFIGASKRRRLISTAAAWVEHSGWRGPYQIDAMSVAGDAMRYIPNITGLG